MYISDRTKQVCLWMTIYIYIIYIYIYLCVCMSVYVCMYGCVHPYFKF